MKIELKDDENEIFDADAAEWTEDEEHQESASFNS